jgi:hypothetical protein
MTCQGGEPAGLEWVRPTLAGSGRPLFKALNRKQALSAPVAERAPHSLVVTAAIVLWWLSAVGQPRPEGFGATGVGMVLSPTVYLMALSSFLLRLAAGV